jgi:hypothetical protein
MSILQTPNTTKLRFLCSDLMLINYYTWDKFIRDTIQTGKIEPCPTHIDTSVRNAKLILLAYW